MAKEKKKTKLEKAKSIIEQQVEELDERIAELDEMLVEYDPIRAERDKLQAARRALRGGNRLTGAGGTRVRQEDIVEFLRDNPGSPVSDIAEKFSVPLTTISSALNRGKNERYLNKNGKWWLRDPKNGINTADDIEDEDE